MNLKIIDDFLSSYHADTFIRIFDGEHRGEGGFPWFFVTNLNNERSLGNYYFNHILIDKEQIYYNRNQLSIFNPLLDMLKVPISDVYRLKVNLYPWTQRRIHHKSHTDYPSGFDLTTALYYVNDNDGVTIFDGKKTVKSKKNRVVLFDGSIRHHSTTPTKDNYRCTINIDYKKKK